MNDRSQQGVCELVALLSVARCPLGKSEVTNLASLDPPTQAERKHNAGHLISIATDPDGQPTYTLARASLSDDFERALRESVALQTSTDDYAGAIQAADNIEFAWRKAEAIQDIALVQAESGLGSADDHTTVQIWFNLSHRLPPNVLASTESGDTRTFCQMLLACSDIPEAALDACSAIARFCPNQADDVSKVAINHF